MVSGTIGTYKEGVGQVRLLGEVTLNSVVRDEYQLARVRLERIFKAGGGVGEAEEQNLRGQKPHRCVAGAYKGR